MWEALENASLPVREGGKLFIAIYNDEGLLSKVWLFIKKTYNANRIGKLIVQFLLIPFNFITFFFADIFSLKNPFRRYKEYKKARGMSIYTDWIDWMGGYPFEVATPDQIIHFYTKKGFILDKLVTTKRHGCNEFVFIKEN
jgi:2-polyprenyl-6-hydroxyphenyl methylase/3-demethylubiquinone-9 3-methyltransferase